MALCLSILKKKKVHPTREDRKNFHPTSEEEREACFLATVAQPGTKLSQVYPDPMRLRKVLLRRAIVDERKPINDSRRNGFNPKPTRFALEAKRLLPIPPPVPPPAPPEPRRRSADSTKYSVFRPELHFLCMLVIYWRFIAHTLHLLNPKSSDG